MRQPSLDTPSCRFIPAHCYHDFVLACQPADGPVEEGCLALHQFLELCDRELTVGVETVPDRACHLANFVFHHNSLWPAAYIRLVSVLPSPKIMVAVRLCSSAE